MTTKKGYYFIDLAGFQNNTETEPRTSSLMVSDDNPGFLEVVGILPHNYRFRPKNTIEAQALTDWLWAQYGVIAQNPALHPKEGTP